MILNHTQLCAIVGTRHLQRPMGTTTCSNITAAAASGGSVDIINGDDDNLYYALCDRDNYHRLCGLLKALACQMYHENY